jgi:hypothetical protein
MQPHDCNVFLDAGELLNDQFLGPRSTRSLLGAALAGVLLLASGCVRWQSVPVSELGERPLPRWVHVTTRDSAHYTLQEARLVAGDTLVGRSADASDALPPVRLPRADIARLEARVPSGPGSIGVGALVVGGVVGLVALIGHAGDW